MGGRGRGARVGVGREGRRHAILPQSSQEPSIDHSTEGMRLLWLRHNEII